MLQPSQQQQLLKKLKRLPGLADRHFFIPAAWLETTVHETTLLYDEPPADVPYRVVSPGDSWGNEESYAWFHCGTVLKREWCGAPLYLRPRLGGYEGLLFVNGEPSGSFANKITVTTHGNHYCSLLLDHPEEGEPLVIDLEFYAGHFVPGTQPFDTGNGPSFTYTFEEMALCHKNQSAIDFAVDLQTLLELYECQEGQEYARQQLFMCFEAIHRIAPYRESDWTQPGALNGFFLEASGLMKPYLERKALPGSGFLGLTGHSHMDTAWLWRRRETVKKCARTFSNALNLMREYPEYRFLQSSAFHLAVIKQHYPSLYRRIRSEIADGRYEPNGGCYIECDCNITGGEFLIRQFLWSQRFTRKEFGYEADCFWLPDTFGYSASIPQIMKGCRLKYFLTTKLSWNDTNRFPYDTFWWEGNDGTRVLTHFNITQEGPEPEPMIQALKPVPGTFRAGERYFAFGQGDGGGGPDFLMLESARRTRNVLGVPQAAYMSLSQFMDRLAEKGDGFPAYSGELYLELHRATLTNQPLIKKNNRRAEQLLRTAEFLTCLKGITEAGTIDTGNTNPLLEILLINQFHDILPGTCIEKANDDCYRDMDGVLTGLSHVINHTYGKNCSGSVTLVNSLSQPWERLLFLRLPADMQIAGTCCQELEAGETDHLLAISGLRLPPLGMVSCSLEPFAPSGRTAFQFDGRVLDYSRYLAEFDDCGYISRLFDKKADRELTGSGYALGTLLACENVPAMWDSWDIDADTMVRFSPCTERISSDVLTDGPLVFRIRNRYRIGRESEAEVITSFYSDSGEIGFETALSIRESSLFVKAAFDVNIRSSFSRSEIQFGNILRSTNKNTSYEQAAFEVCHHKYCDLSEPSYGFSLLNNCKYGVSFRSDSMWLSLHYGGTRPDRRGGVGEFTSRYALLPHDGPFQAAGTVRAAYEFNCPPICIPDLKLPEFSLLSVTPPGIVAETVKPCEDRQKAVILRLYEAEGSHTNASIALSPLIRKVMITDMLETEMSVLPSDGQTLALCFKPFEIKTLKLLY